jgi:Tol biopolymer transport system component
MKNRTAVLAIFLLSPLLTISARADLYFLEKTAGPSTRLMKQGLKDDDKPIALTQSNLWRHMDLFINRNGEGVFSSNMQPVDSAIDLNKNGETFKVFYFSPDKTPNPITRIQYQEYNPKINSSGTHIAFLRQQGDSNQLILYSIKTQEEKVIIDKRQLRDIAWSSDGTQLAYSGEDAHSAFIHIQSLQQPAKAISLITETVDNKNKDIKKGEDLSAVFDGLSWSPDDKIIAFIRHPLKSGSRQLMTAQLDSRNTTILTEVGIEVQAPVSWSSDAKTLLYSALVNYHYQYNEQRHQKEYSGGMQIFIHPINGQAKQLTTTNSLHKHPVFSPDETQVAFLYADALNAQTLELRTMDVTGKNSKLLYSRVNKYSSLFWIDDGKMKARQ